jgi:hypothetical protein
LVRACIQSSAYKLWEKFRMNVCLILNGYWSRTVWIHKYKSSWNDRFVKTTMDVPKSHKQHTVFAHKLQSALRLMDFLSNILNLSVIQRILCCFCEFVLCCCDETRTHVVYFRCLHSDPYFYSSAYVSSTFRPSTSVTLVFPLAMFGLNVVVE